MVVAAAVVFGNLDRVGKHRADPGVDRDPPERPAVDLKQKRLLIIAEI